MAVPFGLSIGDFLAVGKLIGQVATELKENGEAAPEYQYLLIELEALDRALRKLQSLKPAKMELVQLTSIKAAALACQGPLRDFLEKISKFESRLGVLNTSSNRWKGLPRRMQFRTMFREDVKQLRSALAGHVATINLLLMTQAVASISAAEDDRERLASSLENKILMHRRLLDNINDNVDTSLQRQQEIKTQLRHQHSVLGELGKKADKTRQQLGKQEASIEELQLTVNRSQEQTKSVLVTVTEVLSLVTSGVMHLRQIAEQLSTMVRICATFTIEMRAAMSKLLELFYNLQTTIQRIDRNLPMRLYLPTVQFTTALGETMALPYQLCQNYTTFSELLRVLFLDKPGESRVRTGRYLIMNVRGGRLLRESSWQHAVNQDDHLSMSIVVDELRAKAGRCPFLTCGASTGGMEVQNFGHTCRKCGRWSLLTPREHNALPDVPNGPAVDEVEPRRSKSDAESSNGRVIETDDSFELFRQISASYVPDGERVEFNDALEYIDQIKAQFVNRPNVYNGFLDIIKNFQSGATDRLGVIERVVTLLAGNTDLILSFNKFLPLGYSIRSGKVLEGDPDTIWVTDPMGVTTILSACPPPPPPTQPSPLPSSPPALSSPPNTHKEERELSRLKKLLLQPQEFELEQKKAEDFKFSRLEQLLLEQRKARIEREAWKNQAAAEEIEQKNASLTEFAQKVEGSKFDRLERLLIEQQQAHIDKEARKKKAAEEASAFVVNHSSKKNEDEELIEP